MRRWLALGALLILTACGLASPIPTVAPARASTSTVRPTDTPRPPAPTATLRPPTTAPAPPAASTLRTGGLGKTRAEWEATYQKPEKQAGGLFTYANGNYLVIFVSDRVSHIEHSWGDKDAKSLDFALGASRPFFPNDAKMVREYKSRSGSTVHLYRSAALAGVFPPDAFIGGEPGDFIVIFRDTTGKVTSYVIGLGNNP